jgi:hypothetical protein
MAMNFLEPPPDTGDLPAVGGGAGKIILGP